MEFCVFVEPQLGASYEDQLAAARLAEAEGYTGFFRSDHYLTMGGGDGVPGPSDAWTVLAGLARETSRVRLGTLVSSVTFRHPGILAIQVANVDAMSGGRAELGLGAGWYEAEHLAYGIPFPSRRFDILEEHLAVITGLWATPAGSTFDFAGEHVRISGSPALPKPVQERVPVIVGGKGPKRTPELTARFATEYNYFGPDAPDAQFRRVREAAEAIGRDPATIKLSVATTVGGGDTDGELVDRLAGFAAAGARRVYLQFLDLRDLDRMAHVAREVLPKLR